MTDEGDSRSGERTQTDAHPDETLGRLAAGGPPAHARHDAGVGGEHGRDPGPPHARDRERGNALQTRGWIVLRFTHGQVTRAPARVAQTVADALRRGAAR